MRIIAVAGFLAVIIAANYATSTWGLIPVGAGLTATAGTYLAGASFVLRDLVHDLIGTRGTILVVLTGAVISFAVSDPYIAIASATAFAASESADTLVYAPLRQHGYLRASVASNTVGSLVDTLIFLSIAGFPIWSALPGQMLAKLTVTALVVLLIGGARAVLRQPVNAESA